jgi:GNAT superfamily N-acetyltransferase
MTDWTIPSEKGFATLPDGIQGTIETSLERFERPDTSKWPLPDGFRMIAPEPFDLAEFKALYHAVGDDWLWYGRLQKTDDEITAIINAPTTTLLYLLNPQNQPVGLFETQKQGDDTLEVSYFGLVPSATGKRLGPAMMENGLSASWTPAIKRAWLHTCTFDSPHALGFYQKMGFKPFRQRFEWGKDPRLAGLLPRHAAPHIPLADFSKP